MRVCAHLPTTGQDLRLDLFRGLANWVIFLDHIPHEVLSWVTIKNYGLSDAADLFVFISGYVLLMTAVAYYWTWPKRRYPILPSPSNWQNAVPPSPFKLRLLRASLALHPDQRKEAISL